LPRQKLIKCIHTCYKHHKDESFEENQYIAMMYLQDFTEVIILAVLVARVLEFIYSKMEIIQFNMMLFTVFHCSTQDFSTFFLQDVDLTTFFFL
jgi:hypothetical protein